MAEVICNYFGVALLRSLIGLKNSCLCSANQNDAKPKPTGNARSPALGTDYVYLIRILIGSLRYSRLPRLPTGIAIGLVYDSRLNTAP